MTRIAIFAYGSLVDPRSAAETIGREVELTPARLCGWRRRWSQVRDNLRAEKTFAIEPGDELPPWILGLNIEPDPNGAEADGPNGALLEVTESELAALDRRELRYDRVEVTIPSQADRFAKIFAYTAKPAHFAPRPPAGAAIVATYARTVERAFESLGTTGLERFHATTGPPPVEPVEAILIHGRIPPGNPRDW
jgi:cation transport regulator ChaC